MQDAPLHGSLLAAMGYVLAAEKRELREARKTAHSSRALLPWRRPCLCTAADLAYDFQLETRVIADAEAHAARRAELARDRHAHKSQRSGGGGVDERTTKTKSSSVDGGGEPSGQRHRPSSGPPSRASDGTVSDAGSAVMDTAVHPAPTVRSESVPIGAIGSNVLGETRPTTSQSPPTMVDSGNPPAWRWRPSSHDTGALVVTHAHVGADARPAGLSGTGPSGTGHPGSNPGGAWSQVS